MTRRSASAIVASRQQHRRAPKPERSAGAPIDEHDTNRFDATRAARTYRQIQEASGAAAQRVMAVDHVERSLWEGSVRVRSYADALTRPHGSEPGVVRALLSLGVRNCALMMLFAVGLAGFVALLPGVVPFVWAGAAAQALRRSQHWWSTVVLIAVAAAGVALGGCLVYYTWWDAVPHWARPGDTR